MRTPRTSTEGRAIQKVQVVEPAFDARSYLYGAAMNLLGAAGQVAVILFLVYFFLVTGDLYKTQDRQDRRARRCGRRS